MPLSTSKILAAKYFAPRALRPASITAIIPIARAVAIVRVESELVIWKGLAPAADVVCWYTAASVSLRVWERLAVFAGGDGSIFFF